MNRNDLCLLIMLLIYVLFMFYSIINDQNDKDIIEGFSTLDKIKGVITLPIKILKFFLTILKYFQHWQFSFG